MACDGYEHGTRVEVSNPNGIAALLEVGEKAVTLEYFLTAIGIVDEVDRPAHSLRLIFPGHSVYASAHDFRKSQETQANNLRWIIENMNVRVASLSQRADVSMDVINRLVEGEGVDSEAAQRVAFAVVELTNYRCSLRDVFPHRRDLDAPLTISSGA